MKKDKFLTAKEWGSARFAWPRVVWILGFVVGLGSLSAAVQDDGAGSYRLELEELPADVTGTAPFRRLVDREETQDRTVERWVIERPSINSGRFEAVLEVEEETVQIDPETSRFLRQEFSTDANGRQRLVRAIEEDRTETPDGRERAVRTFSEPDLDGRLEVSRQEIEETTARGEGVFQTEIQVLTPGVNQRGFVPTERVEQTEHRDGERVLQVDRTTYSNTSGAGWIALERRVTNREVEDQEVRSDEQIYTMDGNGRLSLSDRIVGREWTDSEGVERSTEQSYSRNVAGLAPSPEPRLHRQVDVIRTPTPNGGSETTRETRELRQDRLTVVERVIERSRPDGRGGIVTEREVQRMNLSGRLETVGFGSSSETEP